MAVIKNDGTVAGANWQNSPDGSAFWVCGRGGMLSSAGFATCVGMVIMGDAPNCGLVAHFWNPSSVNEAGQIVDGYNSWLTQQTGGFAADDMQALVFGGVMIGTPAGGQYTRPRIDAIAGYLRNTWDMTVNTDTDGASEVELNLDGGRDLMANVRLIRPRNQAGGSKKHKHTNSM